MTAPLPPDPADVTDGDRAKAAATLNYGPDEQVSPMDAEYVDAIAAALAAERAAVTRPLLALAEELDEASRLPVCGDFDRGVAAHQRDLVDRLRSAITAALGETGGGQ